METQRIRHFNRYYSRVLGVFDKTIFELPYSMAELRILGEVARHEGIKANSLVQFLAVDKGYLSRMVNHLVKDELIIRRENEEDKRSYLLYLTPAGQKLQQYVEVESDQQIETLLRNISYEDCRRLEASMAAIEEILTKNIPNQLEE